MNRLLALSLFLFLAACERPATEVAETTAAPALPEGVTLVERFEGDDSGISIPYAKYHLDNGLTVILHEDHSDPLVHVDVTYHVGSNREEVGRSGFAHFFEHMMFEGSANIEDGRMDEIITSAGGDHNGTTNSDRTNYFATVPANYLETVLWIESDRMGLLLPAVTQEKFEVQRETVKNERGQRVDNVPYGRTFETLGRALYPLEHPYSWPTIGWIEDLNRADLDDLKRFFLRWYGPNNAVLTIGGDIEPRETLELVQKYFGPIPAGPEVENLPKQPATLESDRYVTLEDNVHLPAIAMMIPTVYGAHGDEAPLDAAAEIMGGGPASLLYQRLVQTGRALQATVNHGCRELACEMFFVVVQNPASGETLAEMEAAIRETLAEFSEREVSADDLQKFKAQYESGRIFALQSVAGKVSTLAAFETFYGTPKGIAEDIERYLGVTAEDVRRTFDQYIDGQPAVILSIVPHGATQLAAAEPDFTLPEREIPEQFADAGEPLPLRPVMDDFDRSAQPQPGAVAPVELPAIWDTTLANGVRVLAVPNTETPTVTVRATFEAGSRDDPPGKAGLSRLVASLMTEATTERSAAEFAEALERIGARISVNSGTYETTVTLNTLTKHLDAAMPLMLERILQPDFNEQDFERIKGQTIEALMHTRKTPQGLANRAVAAVLYGPTHPLSYPANGLPSTVAEITLDDVKAFYAAHIPQHLDGLLVSADLEQAAIIEALQGFAALDVNGAYREPVADATTPAERTLFLVDKPDAAQSSVRTAQPALEYDALGDYFLAGLMNFNLGGTFSSRINLNLREDKGYTYGAGTSFRGGPETGYFGFSGEINRDATDEAIVEVIDEMREYAAEGMTEAEFEFMRNAVTQGEALQYETPGAKLGLLGNILRYDLPLDYRTRQKKLLLETERETLNQLAAELIQPENMAVIVVGDEATIRPDLEALGMPITELDEDGFVKGGD